jgi:hypothetical protein
MKPVIGLLLLAVCLIAGSAQAQRASWGHTPDIVVVGPAGDPRLKLVNDAVAFWNKTFQELGSPFRLGAVTKVVQPVPEKELKALSVVEVGHPAPVDVPALRNLPGDITVFLAASDFVSFTSPFDANGKRFVAIKGLSFSPLNLPNVARNVVTHEFGHTVGLGHNSDPAMLMCGRPAPCRPDAFRSDKPRVFPLTDAERRQLLTMYPPSWEPR